MGDEVLILLWYVSALAVYTDRHEGEVALHSSSRCIVDFEAQTVAASGAGHTAEESWVSVQRDLKGDSP